MPHSAPLHPNGPRRQLRRAGAQQRERNRLVERNLPLVRQVAARHSQRTRLPFEDLVQVGCLGLIRALESFDPGRGHALSSYAVPYIRGAIQHYLRDQEQPLRSSRQLRELHARGQALRQQRQHDRSRALDEAAMADALGCTVQRWREACDLHRALRLRSLDAPAACGDGEATPLVELLAAPELGPSCEPELLQWLQRRLGGLDPVRRRLLEGRVLGGASWRALGEELGMKARVTQRRFEALREQLREEFGAEFGEPSPTAGL
jgi:RNA polymerase sigma factor (sigma-70 family)